MSMGWLSRFSSRKTSAAASWRGAGTPIARGKLNSVVFKVDLLSQKKEGNWRRVIWVEENEHRDGELYCADSGDVPELLHA